MRIGIFCSANSQIDPEYFELTRRLGRWMGENGHTLVFGGCDMGLMECVAQAAHEAGGRTVGVVPSKVEQGGHTSRYIDVLFPTNDLSDRKELLLAQSDVCVALPGGVGTLDEIFTVVAAHTIGYHSKRVILYNMKGFWNPLVALLDALQARGMLRGRRDGYLMVADTEEELIECLTRL